jgi:excisionase family DNA binding protein
VNGRLELTLSAEDRVAIAEQVAAVVLEALEHERTAKNGARWLTLEQAAKRLDCSPDAVRMRVKRKRLEGRRQGRRLYVSAASVDDLSCGGHLQ